MNDLSYRIKLYKLTRKRDKESESLSKKIEEAKKSKDPDESNRVYQIDGFELRIIEAKISILVTRYLTDRANKRFLPVPPVNDKDGYWELSYETGNWHLTNKGITELRKTIREDSKELRESVAFWVSIIFGLLGLIIGVISVLNRK
jgi:hypothetical protein